VRVFVSVGLPTEVKDELYDVQKLVFPSLAKIRWVPKKNIHLTLKFLGEVNNLEEIHEKLSRISFKSFKVHLANFGAFPSWENLKVFWVGLEPSKNVIKLQQEIDSELLSFSNDYQKFSPHLTLGRVKMIKKKKEFLNIVKKIEVNPIEFKINSFQLMQSKLSKDGSKYFVLKEYKA
jgi:RNA 2',3'-cyclic 3'-phosphodiesterase